MPENKQQTKDYHLKRLKVFASREKLRTSQLLSRAGILDRRFGEDLIWELLETGELKITPDSYIVPTSKEERAGPDKAFTCFFVHTCPEDNELYGDSRGKPIDNNILMMRVRAPDYLVAQEHCKQDALPGWGTIVLMVFEGEVYPIVRSDLVIHLKSKP